MPLNSSNLPTSNIFKFEDFPGAPQWFAQFLQALNLFTDPVYQIINGGITYQNLAAPQLFSKTLTAPAAGSVTFNFANPLRVIPRAVILGNVYQGTTTSTHPSSPPVVLWHFSQGTIYVDNITNLTASTQYTVTLVIF